MGFFNRSGKKKGQTNRTEDFQVEMESSSSKKDGKGVTPTPEKQDVTENKDQDTMNNGIVRGDPIIINDSDYILRITDTRMEALITLYRPFSVEELNTLLQENGIVYGIKENTLEILAQGGQNYVEVLIASGTAAQDGRDGYFEYHFDSQPHTEPIVLPDGSVDYNVLGKIELVTEGQHLATYHSAVPCVPGRDVLGNTFEVYVGRELPPLQCKRCAPDETGFEYYAEAEGNVIVQDGRLTVTPVYVVKDDLDATTGNVDFHGDVLVEGNVYAGVTVKTTGTITINGHVETASLFAGKDVILKNGMQGAGNGIIHAGGNVMARFLEQIQVFAGNDINVGALVNCEVEAGRNVIISGNRGTVIGGTVKAVEQIVSASLGNRAAVTTQLIIGLDYDFRNKMEVIDCKIEEYQNIIAETTRDEQHITNQIKTQSTPELNKQKAELVRKKINYNLKLKEILMERDQLIDVNQRSADGKIVVSGIANAGCVIIINGIHEILHSEYKNVTFKKYRKEIRITSNKLHK